VANKPRDYDDAGKEKNGEWQHLVELCLDHYDKIKGSKYRENKITEIKESRRVYEQTRADVKDPWPEASNIELPLCTISVDNLEPRFFAGLVGKKPYVNLIMDGGSPPDEETQIIEDWWNNELEHVIKIETYAAGMVHDILLEGTIYSIPAYDENEITQREFLFDEQGNIQIDSETRKFATQDITQTVFEGGVIQQVPFTDVFIADDVEDWESALICRKVYPTYAELIKAKEDGKIGYCNIDKWLLNEESTEDLSEEQQSPAQELADVQVKTIATIECIECSLSYIYQKEDEEKKDIKSWKEEKIVVQIALDRQVIIRIVKLRELNFKNEQLLKRSRLFAERGRSYGTSIYGKMKSIQEGATKTFNTVMNVAEITMIPWFFYTESTGLAGDIILKPGQGVPCESTEGILFPKFNLNPSQFIEFIYVWTSMWERLLSIGDLQIGRPKEGSKTTATEVMSVIQEGNVKHNYQSDQFKEEFLSIIRTLYDLYYQYMPADKTFPREGKPVPIPRQKMGRKRQFRLTGSTELMNKLIERKENEDLLNLSMADPAMVFDPVPIRIDVLKAYGKDDPEKYINPLMAKLSKLLQEFPQMGQVVEAAIQETIKTAQALEAQGGENAGANAGI